MQQEMEKAENTSKTIKVAIGVPCKGMTDAPAYDNHMTLLAHLGRLEAASFMGVHDINGEHFDYPDGVTFRFMLTTLPRVFPAYAREKIAESAQAAECDYLLFFDDDMLMMPDLFERLFKHQKDIVAALAFMRFTPYLPVIYNVTQGYDGVEKKEYYISHTVEKYPKNTLVECDAVGFGAVLLNMQMLKTIPQPWFMTTSGAGEDIHFCASAKKAGYRVFMDTTTKIGHLGDREVVTEETYERTSNVIKDRETLGAEQKYHD